jgi:plasmid stabilization system protein ParE
MNRPLEFTDLALRDVAKAYAWYEAQHAGLGAEFMAAVEAQLELIAAHPIHFPVVGRDARRALVARFPYSIPFREEGDQIVVLGVLHNRRDPRVLQRRAK